MNYLNEEQLKIKVPSIFTTVPHSSVSHHYQFVNTLDIIREMEKMNWYPVSAKQDKPSKQSSEFVKHMIKFRNPNIKEIQGIIPEGIVINSHNRSFRLTGALGAYRVICTNGLVVPVFELFKVTIKHIGDSVKEVVGNIIELTKNADGVFEKIEGYKNTILSSKEKEEFAKKAADLNWGKNINFDSKILLTSRRVEDEGDSLWNVFNVIQENISQGKLQYIRGNRVASTRGINEIRRDFRVNSELWLLMEAIRSSKIRG